MEILILSALIACAIHLVRSHHRLIARVWSESRWWEKAALCVAVLPIPGPVDELLGVLVIRRVLARRRTP